MNENLTFDGHLVEFTVVGDEVYMTCKGVTGTLTQLRNFFNNKGNQHKFGQCKIRYWKNRKIKIDCLEDTKKQMRFLYKHAKTILNESKS